MNIIPTNKRVILLNPEVRDEERESGLIILATREDKDEPIQCSTVVQVAADCCEVQVGDEVLFRVSLKETFGEDLLDDKYILVKESDIEAKII